MNQLEHLYLNQLTLIYIGQCDLNHEEEKLSKNTKFGNNEDEKLELQFRMSCRMLPAVSVSFTELFFLLFKYLLFIPEWKKSETKGREEGNKKLNE